MFSTKRAHAILHSGGQSQDAVSAFLTWPSSSREAQMESKAASAAHLDIQGVHEGIQDVYFNTHTRCIRPSVSLLEIVF